MRDLYAPVTRRTRAQSNLSCMETTIKLAPMVGALDRAKGVTPLPRRWARAHKWWSGHGRLRPEVSSLKTMLQAERGGRG